MGNRVGHMKRVVRDVIIWWYSISGATDRYQRAIAKQQPLVRVVAFHNVADKQWFSDVIAVLCEDYQVISPEDFMNGNLASDRINVLLTFDDGYQSWLSNVLPVLEAYRIRGLFFINSGLLDVAEDALAVESYMREQLLINPRQPLTWDGAKILLEYGHTLGGHTVNHKNLAAVKKAKREQEILEDKSRTESMCQLQLEYFAFPFGTEAHVSKAALATARAAGYHYAMLATPGFTRPDEFATPRILVEEGQSVASVKRWVEGGYDLFYSLKKRLFKDR